ncbi:hypothetical protein [Pontibacter sp. HJ8]
MKKLKDILKTSLVVAVVATISVSCGDQSNSDSEHDTGTAEAITDESESTQNLTKPRPAPIGDTAKTGEQADHFGDLPSNVDTTARQQVELDKQKKQ